MHHLTWGHFVKSDRLENNFLRYSISQYKAKISSMPRYSIPSGTYTYVCKGPNLASILIESRAYLWWEEFKFLRMWHLNETDNKTDWTLSCSFHRDVCILVDIAISIAHPASCSSLMLNYSKNWNRRIHFCQFIVNQNFAKNCNKVIAQEYLFACSITYKIKIENILSNV